MWFKFRTAIISVSVLILALGNLLILTEDCTMAKAQTIYVDCNGGGNYTTIQDALDAATAGDTIRVWDGVYNESLAINKKINLIGNGTNNTKIMGNGLGDLIYITGNGVKITGFSITGNRSDNLYACIKLDNNKDCIILNNHCLSFSVGIYLDSSIDNKLISNYCTNNSYGIYLDNSDSNIIKMNNCSNNKNGIKSSYSDQTSILDNTFTTNIFSSISIGYSAKNELANNSMFDSALIVSGSTIDHWDTHKIYMNNTYDNRPVYYWIDRTLKTVPSGAGQIFLINCSAIKVEKQNFLNSQRCIYLAFTSNSIIRNNKFSANSIYNFALQLYYSNNNVIQDNHLTSFGTSIDLSYSKFNKILNNTCIYNYNGIYLDYSNECNISNNTCNNNEIGINIDSRSMKNNIFNNYCSQNNNSGIRCYYSSYNFILNNTCVSNIDSGIGLITRSQSCTLINNTILNNMYGIHIVESTWNHVINNNISNNNYGIFLETNSYQNKFEENNISLNTMTGFAIKTNCNNNMIFHNNFINNFRQNSDPNQENLWDYLNQGNYWSNYQGKDNGAGDRPRLDGIGDTKLPFSYDEYPFMNLSGWEIPGIPILKSSNTVSNNGYYSISWYSVARTTGYVLEEDINNNFDSPVVITNGWELKNNRFTYNLNKTSHESYYYRVRAFNEKHLGDWSNIVNISVAFIPEIPSNFQLSVYPEGNALNLTWSPNVKGTYKYAIQSASTGDMWKYLINLSHPINNFNHSGLIDNVRYYYRICAQDIYGQCSPYSEELSAKPHDTSPPQTPVGFSALAISDHEVKLIWNHNHEPDLAGYQIYMKPGLSEEFNEEFELIDTISASNSSVRFSNLTEQVKYYFQVRAFDEVPNYSEFSETKNATPMDETHPSKPKGLKVIDRSYDNLTLQWEPNSENDVIGYYIFLSGSSTGPYAKINLEPIVDTNFIASGLNETTIYYFKIMAVDDAGLPSILSEYASGMTLSRPRPPECNRSIEAIEILEDNLNRKEINLFEIFWDPNYDILEFGAFGQKNITILINQKNGSVTLYPAKDWNGNETITFLASDGSFETRINITIYVSSVNDPPEQPDIVSPESGIEIVEGESLDFVGECYDPDLVYGDKLEFFWYSNIQGKLGEGKELSEIKLGYGQHLVTLEVFDRLGESENNTIYISVAEKKNEPTNGPNDQIELYTKIFTIFLFSALVILILYIVFKKINVIKMNKTEQIKQSEKEKVDKF